MTELDMYRKVTSSVKIPVLANITEFGKTDLYGTSALRDVGIKMVLYPLSAFRAQSKAALNVMATIRQNGTQRDILDTMQTRDELYDILGYHEYERALDRLQTSE